MPAPARFSSSAASVPDAPQGVVYIDTSALVKLVVREAESDALEDALPNFGELATSAITSIELARAVARARAERTAEVADDYAILALLAALAEIPLDVEARSAGLRAAYFAREVRRRDTGRLLVAACWLLHRIPYRVAGASRHTSGRPLRAQA